MTIEELTHENLTGLVQLVIQLWPECLPEEETPVYLTVIDASSEVCYLARETDEYVAFIHVASRRDYVEGADSLPVAYIEGIYVQPGFRNIGIAESLIQAAGNWARRHGMTQMASDTEINNASGIEFHRKMGFNEINRIVCFIKDLPDSQAKPGG